MPFTPLHMGPGIAIKVIMQRRFSLMVFGWSQIVMDIEPLVAMMRDNSELHGLSQSPKPTPRYCFACIKSLESLSKTICNFRTRNMRREGHFRHTVKYSKSACAFVTGASQLRLRHT